MKMKTTMSTLSSGSCLEGFSCPHTRGFHRSQLVSLKIFYCHVLYKEVLRCHSAAPFNGLLSCSLVESRSSLQLFSCSTTPLSVSQKGIFYTAENFDFCRDLGC